MNSRVRRDASRCRRVRRPGRGNVGEGLGTMLEGVVERGVDARGGGRCEAAVVEREVRGPKRRRHAEPTVLDPLVVVVVGEACLAGVGRVADCRRNRAGRGHGRCGGKGSVHDDACPAAQATKAARAATRRCILRLV